MAQSRRPANPHARPPRSLLGNGVTPQLSHEEPGVLSPRVDFGPVDPEAQKRSVDAERDGDTYAALGFSKTMATPWPDPTQTPRMP